VVTDAGNKLADERRVRQISVNPFVLFRLLVEGSNKFLEVQGFPEDAEFLGMAHDFRSNTLQIYVAHASFDQVPLGEMLPEHQVSIRIKQEEKSKLYVPPQGIIS
jgi:hypothetical protein